MPQCQGSSNDAGVSPEVWAQVRCRPSEGAGRKVQRERVAKKSTTGRIDDKEERDDRGIARKKKIKIAQRSEEERPMRGVDS